MAHIQERYFDNRFIRSGGFKGWQERLADKMGKASEEFIAHHQQYKAGQIPVWVSIELWDFGMLSRMYDGLRVSDQHTLSGKIGFKNPTFLASFLRASQFVRNVSAHHGRLWNRSMVFTPALPDTLDSKLLVEHLAAHPKATQHLYSVLCLLIEFLGKQGLAESFFNSLLEALEAFPQSNHVSLRMAGFPDDWKTSDFWAAQFNSYNSNASVKLNGPILNPQTNTAQEEQDLIG